MGRSQHDGDCVSSRPSGVLFSSRTNLDQYDQRIAEVGHRSADSHDPRHSVDLGQAGITPRQGRVVPLLRRQHEQQAHCPRRRRGGVGSHAHADDQTQEREDDCPDPVGTGEVRGVQVPVRRLRYFLWHAFLFSARNARRRNDCSRTASITTSSQYMLSVSARSCYIACGPKMQ